MTAKWMPEEYLQLTMVYQQVWQKYDFWLPGNYEDYQIDA